MAEAADDHRKYEVAALVPDPDTEFKGSNFPISDIWEVPSSELPPDLPGLSDSATPASGPDTADTHTDSLDR